MSTQQRELGLKGGSKKAGPVTCLGLTFESDAERRAHFTALLREKLQDPEFRKHPGFPTADDEAILRMSDPPYYTACPNPFLAEFVQTHGTPYDPKVPYEREPFAVDVSVGKTDQLYKAHGYHTKVPHLAIAPSILHYTRPGDLVLDGFCGSGMTGLAAQWCGTAPVAYRRRIEAEWKSAGYGKPEWGTRRAVLNDLGPAASFIAAGYNLPFDVEEFHRHADRLLRDLEHELGWMYETNHPPNGKKGRINFTVWSEVFSCPDCAGEVNFVKEAFNKKTRKTRKKFNCPSCGTELTKRSMDRLFESVFDDALGRSIRLPKRAPVLINYTVGDERFEKDPDDDDMRLLRKIAALKTPTEVPVCRMMDADESTECWGDEWRAGVASFSHVHHLFLSRPAAAVAAVWRKALAEQDTRLRNAILFMAEQVLLGMSVMNRYSPTHFSQVNRYMSGRLRVLSQHSEVSPWYILDGKLKRLAKAFKPMPSRPASACISTGNCGSLALPKECVDYIFTDPPFGHNFAYAELNFITEAWHGVKTCIQPEAIVSAHQGKSLLTYQTLMRECFEEYYRVLKPGRWMTVVFSNSSNAVWRAIQEAMGAAGFVVADVRTLDKQQGTFNQVHGVSVDQDLIISCYKPTDQLESEFRLGHVNQDSAWSFAKEHLRNVPVFVGQADEGEVVAERTPQMLLDRMIGFHVQRGVTVPISSPEFLQGLAQRFPERDGMYFLPDQVAQYDRKRTSVAALRQLSLFVSDEASAIQWVRQQLHDKPQSFQDLQPQFMRELQGWASHEETVELKVILEQCFLHYDGRGPVPSQVHSYLSSNFKDLRNLDKEDPRLKEKASDRWYVPDPSKQADLDQLRDRALLKEFEEYKTSTQRKLKVFRTEAVRAGFKSAWQARDYGTIVKVAEKLPSDVLQEDATLLMYYDNALTRLGDE